jgi:hypothetical protein
MRTVAGLVFTATCLLSGVKSYAQDDPCSARIVNKTLTNKPLTFAEAAHLAFVTTSAANLNKLCWPDVVLILRCGTQQDATEVFAAVRNEYVRMLGATVFEASQNFVRVSWEDGFNSGGLFRFNFDQPLSAIPKPGQKVLISGAYSSYSREPFQINLANSSVLSMPDSTFRP